MDGITKDPSSNALIILVRHGQSVWNRKPDAPESVWRYSGSIDVPLSEVGIQEALEAGVKLQDIPIDLIFCSEKDRAKTTVSLAMSVHHSRRTPIIESNSPLEAPEFNGVNDPSPQDFIVPVYVSPSLNERNFGNLQGVPNTKHPDYLDPETIKHVRNDFHLKFPGDNGESSADVSRRVIPYFEQYVVPHLECGRNVLVSSHGFVIRTLIKYFDKMTDEEWNEQMKLEKTKPRECHLLAPTGVPLIYRYHEKTFHKQKQSTLDRTESLERTSAAY